MMMKGLKFGLFLLIGCLWVSLGVNTVSAEITLSESYSINTPNGSIQGNQGALHWWSYIDNQADCENTVMVVFPSDCQNNGTIEYNGDELTPVWGANDCAFYLVNPDIGNYSLDFWETTWGAKTWSVDIYCGVDQEDPILQKSANTNNHLYNYNGWDLIISDTIEGETLVTLFATGIPDISEPGIENELCWFTNDRYQRTNYQIATTTSITMSTYGNFYYNTWYIWVTLKPSAPPNPPSTLTIAINDFDTTTQLLHLYGLCEQVGSGINQMRIVGLADNATTSQPVLPDPLGVGRGGLIDCNGTYNAYYDGYGLTGTHWVAIDDTFYGTDWVTFEQDFNASSTPDWEFSYGYMSQDDPDGTASRLACSDEEWATPDPVIGIDWLSATTSVPAFNFTKIKCQIIKQYYISMFSLRDQVKSMGASSASVLGNMFPFNFSTAIKNAWTQSASSTLPTGLEFLNSSNASGTISIPVTIGNASGSVPIWGTAIFNKNASSTAAYNSIRTVSTWLIRLAFFFLVFLLGSKIYHEFNQSKQ